jgi:hypothetical protein
VFHRRTVAHTAVLTLAFAVLVGLMSTDPESWMNLQDDGVLQQVQVVVLGLALISTLVSLARHPHDRPYWLFLCFPVFFLFWRELDLDQECSWIGIRAFSWADLADPAAPLWIRLALGAMSVGLTLAWCILIATRARTIASSLLQSLRASVLVFGSIALVAMGAAQLWDRHVIPQDHPDPYIEEALELLGEIAALLTLETLGHLSALRKNGGSSRGKAGT